MSDDQIQQLGLPRREFLKRAAIGAGVLVAPVIVSFGFGGTAEAAPGCNPNQVFSNMTTVSDCTTRFGNLAFAVWQGEQVSTIDHGFAQSLRQQLLDAERKMLDEHLKECCKGLTKVEASIDKQRGKHIDPSTADSLLNSLTGLYNQLGCANCT